MELLTPSIGLIIFSLVVGLGGLIIWIYALVDIVKSEFRSPNDKIVWVLIVLFATLIGAILYLAIGRRNKLNYS
jgi:hypothetical protein